MDTVTIKSNRHPRPLFSAAELAHMIRTGKVKRDALAEDLPYLQRAGEGCTDEGMCPRLFEYRGSWYDYYEFQVAGEDMKSKGWDAVQGESYFSAVLVTYLDRDGDPLDDEIIVGYAHW